MNPAPLHERPFVRTRDRNVVAPAILAAALAFDIVVVPWWWTAPFAILAMGLAWAHGYTLAKRVAAQEDFEKAIQNDAPTQWWYARGGLD